MKTVDHQLNASSRVPYSSLDSSRDLRIDEVALRLGEQFAKLFHSLGELLWTVHVTSKKAWNSLVESSKRSSCSSSRFTMTRVLLTSGIQAIPLTSPDPRCYQLRHYLTLGTFDAVAALVKHQLGYNNFPLVALKAVSVLWIGTFYVPGGHGQDRGEQRNAYCLGAPKLPASWPTIVPLRSKSSQRPGPARTSSRWPADSEAMARCTGWLGCLYPAKLRKTSRRLNRIYRRESSGAGGWTISTYGWRTRTWEEFSNASWIG